MASTSPPESLPTGPLPAITPFNAAWFTSGEIAIQRCVDCQTLQHPPEEICHACGSMAFDTQVLSPHGTVHSFTVVHYAASPDLADAVPYAVVLVSLDAAPQLRVVGNVAGPIDAVQIGLAVVAYWDEHQTDDGDVVIRLPQWRPA